MKPVPFSKGVRRNGREECEPGDWVDVSLVPEWSSSVASHVFLRGRISISPWEGDKGGIVLSSKPDRWTFVARHRDGGLVWMRER